MDAKEAEVLSALSEVQKRVPGAHQGQAPAPAPWAEWGSEAALPGVLGVELEEKVTDHHSLHHLPPDRQLLHL